MTGLSVLYAREAAKEREISAVPYRERAGRLREVYWLRCAELMSGREPFINARLHGWMERRTLGRRSDEAGDGFVYLARMMPKPEGSFEWLEVTEVFTIVPARLVEGAMEAWHGIPSQREVDFEEFLAAVPRGRPSRVRNTGTDRISCSPASWPIVQHQSPGRKVWKCSERSRRVRSAGGRFWRKRTRFRKNTCLRWSRESVNRRQSRCGLPRCSWWCHSLFRPVIPNSNRRGSGVWKMLSDS